MPDHRRLLLISVAVLTALFFIEYFFLRNEYFFLPDGLPEFIPHGPLSVSGVYLYLCFLGIYYVVFKRILKQNDTISVGYLIIFGFLIALFSEVIFRFYVVTTLSDLTSAERAWVFIKSVLLFSVMSIILALIMAFDLKYKNPLIRWISTFIGVVLMFSLKYVVEYLGILP